MARQKIKPVQANNKPYRDNPDMDNKSGLQGILDTLQDGIKQDPENGLTGIPDAKNGIPETDILSRMETVRERIIDAIANYEIVNNLSVISISQLEYNAVLLYIRDTVIKYIHMDIRDIQVFKELTDIYIEVCYRYKKSVSIMGLSYYIGIDNSILYRWLSSNNRAITYIDIKHNTIIDTDISVYKLNNPDACIVEILNTRYRDILQNVIRTREHSLTDKAEDGSVMSLALGKIEFGWIEGRDKQIQADILEQYRKPSDILQNYEQMLLEHDGQ